jgi:hypothetical protein
MSEGSWVSEQVPVHDMGFAKAVTLAVNHAKLNAMVENHIVAKMGGDSRSVHKTSRIQVESPFEQ